MGDFVGRSSRKNVPESDFSTSRNRIIGVRESKSGRWEKVRFLHVFLANSKKKQ